MSEGEKPAGMGAGKIVLIVVVSLVVLGAVCCAVGGFLMRDKIAAGMNFGMSSAAFAQRLQADLGPSTVMTFAPSDDEGLVLLVGVKPAPEAAELAKVQDTAWRAYCDSYKDGGMPVSAVAIGEAAEAADAGKNPVRKWRKNMISVADVEARTGVKAPAKSALFDGTNGQNVTIHVGTGDEDTNTTIESEPPGEVPPK
ncbi:MAG: hypothetical protein K8T90_13240 [Planctomycetes bacterium]|nr:hypothetical protein [Planctomycetota bacterium]